MMNMQGIAAHTAQQQLAARQWLTARQRLAAQQTLAAKPWHTLGLLAALSCLPTEDLASYSNGVRPTLDPDSTLVELATEAEPPPSGVASEVSEAPGNIPIVAVTPSECGAECTAAALASEVDAGSPPLLPTPAPEDAGSALPPSAPADAGASADAGPAVCSAGALEGPGDRCFQLLSVARTWSEGRTACQNRGRGWDLATIRDAERNAFLTSLLGSVSDAWVGASDLTTEGSWLWVGDTNRFWSGAANGSRVGNAYVNWSTGSTPEPNGGETSDCLRLRSGGNWADLQCTNTFAALCEGPRL